MIVQSVCNSCFQAFELLIETSDIDLVKQVASDDGHTCPCPRLCGGRINLVGNPAISEMARDPRLREPMHISGKELFRAVNGMGLPDEIANDPTVVEALLKSSHVVSVDTKQAAGRVYLERLQLANGVTLHLAAGGSGACVLKITKERS